MTAPEDGRSRDSFRLAHDDPRNQFPQNGGWYFKIRTKLSHPPFVIVDLHESTIK